MGAERVRIHRGAEAAASGLDSAEALPEGLVEEALGLRRQWLWLLGGVDMVAWAVKGPR